jgi:hypothetical protein
MNEACDSKKMVFRPSRISSRFVVATQKDAQLISILFRPKVESRREVEDLPTPQ